MKKIIFIAISVLFIFLCVFIYKLTTYTYITAKFKELRPIHNPLPVYYKGIIIGKAKEKKHSDSFEHTLIKLVLYPKNLLLPVNTTVMLKKEKRNNKEKDFLELIYPKNPEKVMISNGSVLEGISSVDLETFMKNQHPDDLETVKEDLWQSVQNLNYALQGFNQMFELINEILNENKPNLYNTTKNIDNMTKKIDNSLNQQKLDNTISNIELSTKNVSELTDDSKGTLESTNLSLEEVQGIAQNVNAITCGVRKTLRKKFGGLRLFFGRVIDECDDY